MDLDQIRREWKAKFNAVTAKINNGTATDADRQEYRRLLNEEPDDPDGHLEQILNASLKHENDADE